MFRKILARGAFSYCVTVTISVFIGMIIGLCGSEHICMPAFIERVGSPVTAAFLQPILIGFIGFAFGAGSLLFSIERWSFLKQGAIHLALTAAVWIIVELICFTPITPPVVVSFTVSAAFTYAVTWSIQYFVWRAQVRRINEQIHRRNEESHA